jgi:CBS-domain-containing membrane protein
MRVEEIMATDVVTISADRSIDEAASEFRNRQVHHLLVVDDDLVLVGVLGDRELAESSPSDRPVREIMTGRVHSVAPIDPIEACVNLMLAENLHTVPVVRLEDHRLVGIVNSSSLMILLLDLVHAWPTVRSCQAEFI